MLRILGRMRRGGINPIWLEYWVGWREGYRSNMPRILGRIRRGGIDQICSEEYWVGLGKGV